MQSIHLLLLERSIIERFVKHVVVTPAFTGERLFDDLSETLRSNGLLAKTEVRRFNTLRHYIILFAAVQMHRCSIVIDDYAIPLSVMGHGGAHIQVDCAIPIFFQLPNIAILNLSSAMFQTDLNSDGYCESSLLSTPGPWTFPIELSSTGQLCRLQ